MSTAFNDVKPWPGKAPMAVGSVPGNNRPIPSEDALREFNDLLAQRDGFNARIDALVGSAGRASAHDTESAGRCGELIKQITAAAKVVEEARVTVKEPYLEAGRSLDAHAKVTIAPLLNAKASVTTMLNTFMREEEEKRRAEQRRIDDARRAQEAEQRAREEAARAANQPAPEPEPVYAAPEPVAEPTRIRGDFGALTSAKTVWKHEITDWTVAFMAVEQNEKVREAIDKAIGAMVRSGTRKIEGVRVFSDTVASVR
jgi:hypothetical protein